MPLLSTTSPLLGKTTHSMDSQASSGGRAFKRDFLDWWIGSLSIYPNIRQLLPMKLCAANESTIHSFIGKVRNWLQKLKITDKHDLGDRLWNCDESGVCTLVVSSMVLARRGVKWSMRQQVDLDVRSPPSMWVDQLWEDACLHSLCIRGNICIFLGQREAL